MMIEIILWYLIVLDCLIYNFLAWMNGNWYKNNFRLLSRHLPITKLFGIYYGLLTLWLGSALWRLNYFCEFKS